MGKLALSETFSEILPHQIDVQSLSNCLGAHTKSHAHRQMDRHDFHIDILSCFPKKSVLYLRAEALMAACENSGHLRCDVM